jgi:hypothetical protein
MCQYWIGILTPAKRVANIHANTQWKISSVINPLKTKRICLI